MKRLASVFLLVAACSDDGGMDTAALDAGFETFDAGSCAKPLARFCEGACPSYVESVAEVEMLAMQLRCFIAESGTCGPLRYTYFSSGFGGFQAWFDAGGALVAGRRFSDTREYCDESEYEETYGALPVCEPVPTAMYCRP